MPVHTEALFQIVVLNSTSHGGMVVPPAVIVVLPAVLKTSAAACRPVAAADCPCMPLHGAVQPTTRSSHRVCSRATAAGLLRPNQVIAAAAATHLGGANPIHGPSPVALLLSPPACCSWSSPRGRRYCTALALPLHVQKPRRRANFSRNVVAGMLRPLQSSRPLTQVIRKTR